jgi:hypothetical protein
MSGSKNARGDVFKQLFGRSADALTNFFANAGIVLRHLIIAFSYQRIAMVGMQVPRCASTNSRLSA